MAPLGSAGSSAGGAPDAVDPDAVDPKGGAGAGGGPASDPTVPPSTAGLGGAALEPSASAGAAATPRECIYQLVVDGVAGAGGAGGWGGAVEGEVGGQGGAAPTPTITSATNRLIGGYLTDAAGRALYVFGADLAGDCEALPISSCDADCLLSWPIFHVDSPLLGPGLEQTAFGSFARPDGRVQTTYYGWPLYYYANDSEPGDVTGHGSGVWGLAQVVLPNVVVRKVGMDRFLADGAGRTLYGFAQDMRGTATTAPKSTCLGDCREQHRPFSPSYVGAISTLQPRDFTSFLRADGTAQVAYKGAPLYYSLLDGRPGAVNGAEEEGFTIVLK